MPTGFTCKHINTFDMTVHPELQEHTHTHTHTQKLTLTPLHRSVLIYTPAKQQV